MNFHQPTQDDLRALCGWFVSTGNGHVAEVIEPIIGTAIERPVVFTTSTQRDPHEEARRCEVVFPPLPWEEQQQDAKEPCKHSFNIKTRHCVKCGISYFEHRARMPELF